MYAYDAIDEAMLADRTAEFRAQCGRRLAGEITEEQFKPVRLMNGLYLQLHAYMLRIAIPYGTLTSRKLRMLAHVARTYDRGYGHFTTRTNLQLHWIKLRDAPDILDELASVGLHSIQTSGNCIRNLTADPHAGAAADEVDDPRIWAEAIRQWSTFHPEFSFLPRKFKIAVTGAPTDRAAIRVYDIGLRLHRDDAGALAFEVRVGGGLGRTPYLGPVIRESLPARHLLSYLQAILRVYNRYGRRDNLWKARIKVLVASLGAEAFAHQVEEEWGRTDKAAVDLPDAELARIRAAFQPRGFEILAARSAAFEAAKAADPAFARFVRRNVIAHKVPGYALVNIALKAPGETPGDMSAEQMDLVADLAERFSLDEVRVTYEQNLLLPHVKLDDVPAIHAELAAAGLASPNIGLITDIIACPGLDYCALANARAIPIAQQIAARFADHAAAEAVGELRIKISGCINACGHHHVGHIGILGVDKKGEEFYQLTLGGSAEDDAAIGQILGPALPADKVAGAVEQVVGAYRAHKRPGERFIDTFRRTGLTPFKEAVYAEAH
ncbi:MAG TPA: nitrite/sulfite reductase [Caulobacteraceae bacterium]|nr:nitrite/sulfite reductase [Caulobacteraceae bacterium]